MLTIGNRANIPHNSIIYLINLTTNLGINIKNLSLISDPSKTENIINEHDEVIRVVSPNEFSSFYQSLSEDRKSSLNQRNSYKILSNPLENLNIPNNTLLRKLCSFLALKHPNLIALIRNPEFKPSINIRYINDILLLQSILMHNSREVDAIRGLSDLTDEQDNKRQQVLKKIAIASLVNENLHEKSLDILKDIPPQNFTEEDKKIIQLSIDFLSASIILLSTYNKDEEAISQFNLLQKVLKVYGDKFNTPEHNITLHMPENITKALEEMKKFEMAYLPKDNKEDLLPKVSGEISPVAPNLTRDHLQSISNQVILSALKERPSAMLAQGRGEAITDPAREAQLGNGNRIACCCNIQ
jgi:hypothetical protein